MDIAVFIGPEGGFEETEVEEARAAGFYPVSLGKRILRTETAGLDHAVDFNVSDGNCEVGLCTCPEMDFVMPGQSFEPDISFVEE